MRNRSRDRRPSRREFLKLSSLAAAGLTLGNGARGEDSSGDRVGSDRTARSNTLPGHIVIYHEPELNGQGTINVAKAEEVVHHGVRLLTEIGDTAAAFESLFPTLSTTTKIAIKVNCIGPCDTRWEMVRGIVSGLGMMLGGTYDISNISIYDNRTISGHGYTDAHFDFDGDHPLFSYGTSCSSGHYPVNGHQISDHLYYSDYLINVPALKSHGSSHEITLALKNHYGSCCPANICGTGGVPKMLDLNCDPHIRDKTILVVMDGIRGTYDGSPGIPPQQWQTFPELTPNTMFFSTDPVTNEYWGRDMINAERISSGDVHAPMSPKSCPWVEQASGDPYWLGTSDPAAMTVIRYSLADVPDLSAGDPRGLFLLPNVPNPFRGETVLRFRLPLEAEASLTILDPAGRVVRRMARRGFPAGYTALRWDGRDEQGQPVAAGTYLACLETNRARVARRMLRIR